MLAATMGYMEGAYGLCHFCLFGAEVLPPNRCACEWVLPSLAGSVSGNPLEASRNQA